MMHSLLSAAYLPLRLGNYLLRHMGVKSDARLRVLICHDIAPHEQERFAAQLSWLAQSWTFVTPQQFVAMMKGNEPIKGANLLLTFDDGFSSNSRVAKTVLNPMGIKALFFVVSDFVDIVDEEDCQAFIANHICPELSRESIPNHWRNMSWGDLAWLLESGHTIGAHTRTHVRLSELLQVNELVAEIVDSANVLERKLGVKIEHFAFPFGNLASFSPSALAVAKKRFSFIYTGLRGDNASGVPPWALRRDAVSPVNSNRLVGTLLEGGADILYNQNFSQCKLWGGSNK